MSKADAAAITGKKQGYINRVRFPHLHAVPGGRRSWIQNECKNCTKAAGPPGEPADLSTQACKSNGRLCSLLVAGGSCAAFMARKAVADGFSRSPARVAFAAGAQAGSVSSD